jgi:hypothetical protein
VDGTLVDGFIRGVSIHDVMAGKDKNPDLNKSETKIKE